MNRKRCPKCERILPLDRFNKSRNNRDGLHCYCRECHNRYNRSRYDSESWHRSNVARKYGIPAEQYDVMHEQQQGCCAICKKEQGQRRLHVDHCHTTGTVRALLCFSCNTAIGHFQEDPELLDAAIHYLRDFSALKDVRVDGAATERDTRLAP